MKITNIKSGKPYQLYPDTVLSVERTNPFFNDYGEQTLPVSLPDSEYNRMILDQPGIVSRKDKVSFLDISIQDGEYQLPCRQAILSVSPGDSIDTSFYLNDGSFYTRLENTYMTDVFGEETVTGVNNLDQAIGFIKSLFVREHPEFSIFRVEISQNRYLNVYNVSTGKLEAEDNRTETIDGKVISIPRGFYVTPFLKANFVLQRIFAYFGYRLLDNFFTRTEQFRNMVFVNNVADAIVTGKIYYAQLLPNTTCKELLELFRRKFMCEFISDEVHKTISVVLFNELVTGPAYTDLTAKLVDKLIIEYPSEYKQIILHSRDTLDEAKTFDSIPEIKSKYPTVQFDPHYGKFYRYGYNLGWLFSAELIEEIASTSQRYYEGGNLPAETVEVPECIPICRSFYLYIGQEQFLNSSLQSEQESDEVIVEDSNTGMYLMLAFAYRHGGWMYGTVTNYIYMGGLEGGEYKRMGDYSLVYNGDDGIFEKFYRTYDTLLRNSLHSVNGKFILDRLDKQNIPSIAKLIIRGSQFLLSSMEYQLGGKVDISELKLLTLQLYEPISRAKKISDLLPDIYKDYKWELKQETRSISADEYMNSPFKDATYKPVYPPAPKKEMMGKRFFESKSATNTVGVFMMITSWLEVKPI